LGGIFGVGSIDDDAVTYCAHRVVVNTQQGINSVLVAALGSTNEKGIINVRDALTLVSKWRGYFPDVNERSDSMPL